jgi:gliding motility-associated protein GldM
MAGGKETPRQKMIGMMYLVLTALLALQVSSAIIQKFKFLDDSLQFANNSSVKVNSETQKKIQKAVEDAGGKASDKAVLDKANLVRQESAKMISYMNELRTELIEKTGGKEEDGGYKGAKEETLIEVLMVGPDGSGKGKGYELQKQLNAYAQKMSDIVGPKNLPYVPLARDAKDDINFQKDKEQNRKDFANLNFAQTPMVAALAVLSTKQAEVLKLETLALDDLAEQVGAADLKFDNVVAMVRPASKVVAAGTKYEADMFLAASSSAIVPTMTQDGRSIPVEGSTKIGKVSFTATPGAYDKDGNAKKRWKGSISFKFKGKDTTFQVDEEYIVARPVISVQSASVSALYRNCGNELNVQVPALGSTYNPSFAATGAQVIKSPEKGKVTLVPTGAKVTLSVSSNGNLIGSQDFAVRLIPKPTIECLTNGQPVNEKTGVPAPGPRSLVMKAVPDESFKTFLPKDARYRVAQWDCILVRGKRPLNTQTYTSEMANLAAFASVAQAGDRILIDVKKVTRTNFLNQTEDVSMPTIIKNIPIN